MLYNKTFCSKNILISISKDDYIKAYQKMVDKKIWCISKYSKYIQRMVHIKVLLISKYSDIRLIWRIAYQQMKSYTLISREGLYKKYQRIVDINVFRNIVDIKKYWNLINVTLFFCIKVYQKLMCIKVHQISSFILTISVTGLCWKIPLLSYFCLLTLLMSS